MLFFLCYCVARLNRRQTVPHCVRSRSMRNCSYINDGPPFSHARGRDVSYVPSHHTAVAAPPRDKALVCVGLELAPELIAIVAVC